MKYIVLVITCFSTWLAHAEMTLPTEVRGECYIAEFKHPKSQDINTLSICVNKNDATARMIYSNSGALSAVCYQKGEHLHINDNEFHIKFKEGQCDNNRTFSPDIIVCKSTTSDTFKCISHKGEMTLKKLHRYNEKT